MFGLWRRKEKTRQELGRIGEAHAARYLASRGYRIRERNFRAASGEVDIVAEHDGLLAFIEVKARSSEQFGRPSEGVTSQKRGRIAHAADAYIAAREGRERAMRFDIVEVFLTPQGRVERIEVHQGAFTRG